MRPLTLSEKFAFSVAVILLGFLIGVLSGKLVEAVLVFLWSAL